MKLEREIKFLLIFLLILVGLCLSLNAIHSHLIPWFYRQKCDRLDREIRLLLQETESQCVSSKIVILTLDLSGIQKVLKTGKGAILFDARPEVFYRMGHIPSAISLPRDDFLKFYENEQVARLKKNPVVVYCSDSACQDSTLVARALLMLGFSDVKVYRAGWEEWSASGLPVEERR